MRSLSFAFAEHGTFMTFRYARKMTSEAWDG